MDYTIISNMCLAANIYQFLSPDANPFFVQYTTPFIASMFVDDWQYLKFCENYDYYTSIEPVFGEARKSEWNEIVASGYYGDTMPYLVMYLGDIDIHWPYERNKQALLKKYKARLELSKSKEPIFIISASNFMTLWQEKQIDEFVNRFIKLKYRSIIVAPRARHYHDDGEHISCPIPQWERYSFVDREKDGVRIGTLRWANHYPMPRIITDIIQQRFMGLRPS